MKLTIEMKHDPCGYRVSFGDDPNIGPHMDIPDLADIDEITHHWFEGHEEYDSGCPLCDQEQRERNR